MGKLSIINLKMKNSKKAANGNSSTPGDAPTLGGGKPATSG